MCRLLRGPGRRYYEWSQEWVRRQHVLRRAQQTSLEHMWMTLMGGWGSATCDRGASTRVVGCGVVGCGARVVRAAQRVHKGLVVARGGVHVAPGPHGQVACAAPRSSAVWGSGFGSHIRSRLQHHSALWPQAPPLLQSCVPSPRARR